MDKSDGPVKKLTPEQAEQMKKELEQFFKDFPINIEWHDPLLENLLNTSWEQARARMDTLNGARNCIPILQQAPRVPSTESKRDVLNLGEPRLSKTFFPLTHVSINGPHVFPPWKPQLKPAEHKSEEPEVFVD